MDLQLFKDNFYDAVYQHTRKLFWPSMGINILTLLVIALTLIPLFFNLFPDEVIKKMMTLPKTMEDMTRNSSAMESFAKDHLTEFIIFYVSAVVVGLLLWSYATRIGYDVSKRQLEGDHSWFGLLFSSLDRKFIKMAGFALVMTIMGFAAMFLATSFARFGVILFFLSFIAMLAYLLRFILAGPAIIIGDMTVLEGMRYSARVMGWGKSFKLLFFIFVAMIVVVITALIISLLTGLILGNGVTGNVVGNFLVFFINAAVFSLMIAGSAGLFYRYGNFETPEESGNPEDQVSLIEPE